MEATKEAPKGKAMDFVYIGKRPLTSGGMGHVIHWIEQGGGRLGEKAIFKPAKDLSNLRVVGGVYTGARFDGKVSYGLGTARYTGRWTDTRQVAEWESEMDAFDKEAKAKKMATDDAANPVFDNMTIAEVRRLRYAASKRGDYATASAIRDMALLRIDKLPTKAELEREDD